MQLKEGCSREYKRRHDEIWPELVEELHRAGVRDYVIFLDEHTGRLFASQKVTEHNQADSLAGREVVQRWWAFMADLMETNQDNSPVVQELSEMFYQD